MVKSLFKNLCLQRNASIIIQTNPFTSRHQCGCQFQFPPFVVSCQFQHYLDSFFVTMSENDCTKAEFESPPLFLRKCRPQPPPPSKSIFKLAPVLLLQTFALNLWCLSLKTVACAQTLQKTTDYDGKQ